MRATTSRNRPIEAAIITSSSMPASRPPSSTCRPGAIREATVSTLRRIQERLVSFSGTGSSSVRIEGCSAEAPHSR